MVNWFKKLNQFTTIITPGGNVIPNHGNKNTVDDFNSDYEKREIINLSDITIKDKSVKKQLRNSLLYIAKEIILKINKEKFLDNTERKKALVFCYLKR